MGVQGGPCKAAIAADLDVNATTETTAATMMNLTYSCPLAYWEEYAATAAAGGDNDSSSSYGEIFSTVLTRTDNINEDEDDGGEATYIDESNNKEENMTMSGGVTISVTIASLVIVLPFIASMALAPW